jgi:hypothetical protein
MTRHSSNSQTFRRLAVAIVVGVASCSSKSDASSAASTTTTTAVSGASSSGSGVAQVLPVTTNPISNSSTAQTLKITSVLVENNVDPVTGKAAEDHLEITLTNTGPTELSGFEVYTTYTDPTDKISESYYTALPATFTIAPGANRVAHFDATGATDHFPVNKYSLFSTSRNALDVEVVVSANGAAVQTTTLKKDAGGAENPSE